MRPEGGTGLPVRVEPDLVAALATAVCPFDVPGADQHPRFDVGRRGAGGSGAERGAQQHAR